MAVLLLLTLGLSSALFVLSRDRTPTSAVMVGLPTLAVLLVMCVVAPALWVNDTVDRSVYLFQVEQARTQPLPWTSARFAEAPLFATLVWVLARIVNGEGRWLFVVAAAAIAVATVVCQRIMRMPLWAGMGAWLMLVTSGMFMSYSGIAVRQGFAMALLLPSACLVAVRSPRRVRIILLALAAVLFHWTAAVPALMLVFILLRPPKMRTMVLVWVFAALLFATGISRQLASSMNVGAINRYSSEGAYEAYGSAGLRWDFLAVSLAVFLLALVLGAGRDPERPLYLLSIIYLAFNAIFLCGGFIAFSDRLVAYSWFIAPIMIWLAVSSEDRNVNELATVALLLGIALLATFGGTLDPIVEVLQ